MSRRNKSSRATLRSLGFLGLLGLLGAGACVDLSKDLDGEPCTVAKDCWQTQECTQTPEEALLELPGLCKPKGHGCSPGKQLGCICDPGTTAMDCSTLSLPTELQATYPMMVCDPELLLCVVETP